MQYALMLQQNIFTEMDDCQQKLFYLVFFFLVILVTIPFLFPFCYSKQNKIHNKKILLIGISVEEENKIFNILTENKIKRKSIKQEIGQFYEFTIENNLNLVDSPFSIEKDDSQEKKEEIIKQLALYIKQYINEIQRLYLVVNFVRTNQMKENFYENIKYFQKFSNIIDIIVTNFQLSEDEIKDKENLIKVFSLLVNDQKKIHFIKDDIKIKELKQIIIQNANLFDYQNTIFEDIDDSEKQNLTKFLANGKLYQSIQIVNDEH